MKINIKKQQMSYRGLTTISSKIISILNCFYGYRGQATV
ncbi:RPE4 domain protein [Rickettsia amblyommatis str. Ac/Pa]|uniref:RPE4 domain protein n=1 Tax=Rickettsia amblyommatis str. Ac/Pa TaxID=1359164 RepID=A0A0F3MZI2_RICAM|nr:RPE4 domain protein [Rickettsia amblyommatis str. Ac/Pa]